MWECANCGETVEDNFDVCWNCQTEKGSLASVGDTKNIWQQKSDEELITASEHLPEYTKGAEGIIRAELRRRGMPEPGPILRTIEDEPRKQPATGTPDFFGASGTKPLLMVGIIMVVVAVAVIIISQNLLSIVNPQFQRDAENIRALQGVVLLGGIGLLIVGGIISAVGFSQFISTRPTTQFAPTIQPVVSNSVSAGTVDLGNTPDQVQSVMGPPDKIINLGPRVIHVYKDMKIIYVDGRVSDVQL